MNSTSSNTSTAEGNYADTNSRWRAVVERDVKADGLFFYSVRTTGVFCRPSCPSRSALNWNVVFHDSPEEAEKAGFRPCLRCRPTGPERPNKEAIVAAACRALETEDEVPKLEALAKTAGLSLFRFHVIFKAITGTTPKAYALAWRANRVREQLLKRPSGSDPLYNSAFGGRHHENSPEALGVKPKPYRKGGTGEAIRFAVGTCSLGSVLVASTAKGLCAVLLGDDADSLVQDLENRFPNAYLIGGDEKFDLLVAKVVGLIERPRLGLDLPLDIQGTVFQQKVWQILNRIPVGSTSTYADIARRLNMPNAVRAVAQACAANPLAVAIPCHRVVRMDGDLSGYRWGNERKKTLLEREAN